MRRLIPLFVLGTLLGCSAGHSPEGDPVKPGVGVAGVPGGTYGVSASHAVPVTPGTLIVLRDGVTAVASDADRDKIWIVDVPNKGVRSVDLGLGEEPGKLVEDGNHRVHIATRRGGELVTIDVASASIVSRRAVCPAPRGVAWDDVTDLVHVACQTGELVSLPAAGGDAVRSLKLARDLRDVVVDGERLIVSRLKTAEVFTVSAEGIPGNPTRPPDINTAQSGVAWRMIKHPAQQGVYVAHQRARQAPIQISVPDSYGSSGSGVGCSGGIIEGAVTPVNPDTPESPVVTPPVPLMVGASDIALSADGSQIAVVSTGNSWGLANQTTAMNGGGGETLSSAQQPLNTVTILMTSLLSFGGGTPCASSSGTALGGVTGEPTSVAFLGNGGLVIFSRQPAQIQTVAPGNLNASEPMNLTDDSRADTGLALFQMNSGAGLACASCHPEGNEDGRVWNFAELGPRRTQNPTGGVLATAPFHWSGELNDFPSLIHDVFESRMGAARPNHNQIDKFEHFINGVQAPAAAVVDSAAAERGRAIFENAEAGCSSCHSGAHMTNNQSFDVGTRGSFQVPSLIGVGSRAPFMHDGCAQTLADRFGPCGGGLHGSTSQLDQAQISDLVTFLESL